MGKNPTDSLPLLLKESRSTSPVVNPSSSISECLIVVTLPQELITEILVCLPVKSLLRFKCVSKPWLSLISDQQFIKSHFSKSTSIKAGDLNLELLFATTTRMTKCSLYSALHDADPSMYGKAIEPPADRLSIVVGIINGLVCLNLKGTDLCIWNPALGKVKNLNVYPEAPSDTVKLKYTFSFGYEESSDDYKVVCLQSVQVIDGFTPEANIYNVCIYSLKADSWKRIDDLKGFYLPSPGVFANGKIYWPGDLFATRNLKNVGLDMLSEKFVELQRPKYDAGKCHLKMGVSGGQPLVLCVYHDLKKVDLWVLDKHGVEESWCKFVSMPSAELGTDVFFYNYRVLCISSKGEIVLGDKHGLIVYNWNKKEYRKIKLAVGMTTNWRIAAYVESLIWPNYT